MAASRVGRSAGVLIKRVTLGLALSATLGVLVLGVLSSRAVAQNSSNPTSLATQPRDNQSLRLPRFEAKDYASLTFSFIAFVLSLISLRQKKLETQRTLRSQLTDAVGKLNASFESVEKLRQEQFARWHEPQMVNLRSYYNGQKLFYARQAIYVGNQIPHLVSDVEYNSIARAFADSDDDAGAFLYYEKAINAASDTLYKAVHRRGYGRVLIRAGRLLDGRREFETALALVGGNSDSERWFRAETLQRWAMLEDTRGDHSSATVLFDRAEAEYLAIDYPPRRNEGLSNLHAARTGQLSAPKSGDGSQPSLTRE